MPLPSSSPSAAALTTLLLLASCTETAAPTGPPPQVEATLAVGGDVVLARRMNALLVQKTNLGLGSLQPLLDADLTFVNLETVVASGGIHGVDKGSRPPYYFRGEPETLGLLIDAGVDVVGMANNHTGDYGPDAIIEGVGLLDAAGMGHSGAGATFEEACAPTYRHAGELVVAFLSMDRTQRSFAATAGSPGTCYLPRDAKGWKAHLTPRIKAARAQADLVMVAVHWGANHRDRPIDNNRKLAHVIIDAGADAVLGSSAHRTQGVEVYKGRPVLFDTGNFLWESHLRKEEARSMLFLLELSAAGVHQVRAQPIDILYGRTVLSTGTRAADNIERFVSFNEEFGTTSRVEGTEVIIDLPPPPARPAPTVETPPDPPLGPSPTRRDAPPDGCEVDAVPEDVATSPVSMGGLTLLGHRVTPTMMSKHGLVWVETWWRAETAEPITDYKWLYLRIDKSDRTSRWWGDHVPCDWTWPPHRWTPGTIIHDRYQVRSDITLKEGQYGVFLDVFSGSGPVKDPHPLAQIIVDPAPPAKK
jgi:poly-gamma-glutamate capsule biosynthesis protein CapA/YwtB (metallophosphatase superfamily)